MLFGELPFDEDNLNTMFKYIKEAKYYMHGTASAEAKDLLNKMLQPNPFKRITIPEIINHPWFEADFNQMKFYDELFTRTIKNEEEVDENIVDKLFTLKLGLNQKDREKIVEAIDKGEKYDFCIAYEYLKHSKMLQNFEVTITHLHFYFPTFNDWFIIIYYLGIKENIYTKEH